MTAKPPQKDTVILERRFVPEGKTIMKEGEKGSEAFLIQSGKVKILAGSEDKQVELATIGTGQIFGEMALVFDEPRTASVIALEDCNLIVITRDKLNAKLEKSDPTVRAIVPMLMKRIVHANNALLNKEGSVESMLGAVNMIYENLNHSVGPQQKKLLENLVLPQLEDFIDAVKEFEKRNQGS